jgi:hypothetical protein
MSLLNDEIVVTDIAGSEARLSCGKVDKMQKLTGLGFVSDGDRMVRPISDDADRRAIIASLIQLDALFSGGAGWSPAELVGYYQDRKEITSPCRRVAWKSPTQHEITIQD